MFEPIDNRVAGLGESPRWDATTESIVWVDHTDKRLHRLLTASGNSATVELPDRVVAVLPADDGTHLAVGPTWVQLLDIESGALSPLAALPETVRSRHNDATTDSSGRVLVTSTGKGYGAGSGSVWSYHGTQTPRCIIADLWLPNGISLSPDQQQLHVADTFAGQILTYQYDIAAGAVVGDPHVTKTPDLRPDGLTTDVDGFLWVCFMMDGFVRRYDVPSGTFDEYKFPVSRVTACCFGGDGLADLYLTTAGGAMTYALGEMVGLSAETVDHINTEHDSGKLFRARFAGSRGWAQTGGAVR